MTIKKVQDDFTATQEKMMSRASSFQGGAARIYKLYQKFQTERFKTENASEGSTWKPLSLVYAERKLKQFKSYPGSGRKMMIASGTLAGAVIGPGAPFSGTEKHRAVFGRFSMQISVEEGGKNAAGKPFNYAGYANEKRSIMDFSDAHLEEMKEELSKYILGE